MTENSDKKYGRTFFDIIAEYPKLTFFSFLIILVIMVILIFLRVPFKVGGLEVGDKPVIHDTIVKIKTDTQYIDGSPIYMKRIPQISRTKGSPQNTRLKTGDTMVSVQNQPTNINTGTNNGIIGNNNDVKVNVNEIQRRLDGASKQRLLQLINETFMKNKNIVDSTIYVSALSGNNEAFVFATEILQFLKVSNLNVDNFIGQFQQSPPIKGVEVGRDFEAKNIVVKVGYR